MTLPNSDGPVEYVTHTYSATMTPPDWWPIPGLWVYPKPGHTHAEPYEVRAFSEWAYVGSPNALVAIRGVDGFAGFVHLDDFADETWWRHGPAPKESDDDA